MYAEEDLAEKTKELVLKRGRKSLEFSERDLELARRRAALVEGYEMPKKLEEKQHAVEKARRDREAAEASMQKQRMEIEISEVEARNKIRKAERKLDDLKKQEAS